MKRAQLSMAMASLLLPFGLGGCSIIFPEDLRVGEEPLAECVARLTTDIEMLDFRKLSDAKGALVPTYTFDITKLPFSAKQALIQPGADETLGSRLTAQTNELSTAMAMFMKAPVDEKGAFFFGTEPALWRVRGEPFAYDQILAAGCERQSADMRLIRVSAVLAPSQGSTNTETSSDSSETNP